MIDKCHSNNLIIMKLKNINLGLGLMALLALSSCADDKFSEYRTDMTKNLKEYQYLNNYEPLKKYVEDMKAAGKCNPDFKLGIALEAAEFNKQALVYCLAGSNFNEMTAGNAMKMASCVKDDGSMDFSLVKEFVKNAKDADMTIYGHTLAWHAQAANKYLKNLIKDKELPPDPNGGNKYLEIACGEAGANKWDKQISYVLPKALVKGQSYVMTVKVKASDGGTFAAWPIWEASDNKNQWGGSNDVQYMEDYDITNDYSTLKWEFTANFPIDKLQFVFGNVGGTISCDDFKLTKAGSDEKYQVVKTLDAANDTNDSNEAISGYMKLDDVKAFLDEVGVTSTTNPSSVTLSSYGISKKADDIDELYIIPSTDQDGQNVAGKYFLVNTSGKVVDNKSRNRDGNDYYYCVNTSGNIVAIYTEK